MSIFDGLPDIFTETLGAPVVYTPKGGSPISPNPNAIVVDDPRLASFDNADMVANNVVAHMRCVDVPNAAEGDSLVELENPTGVNRSFRVVQPIDQDGKGMTTLTLEKA